MKNQNKIEQPIEETKNWLPWEPTVYSAEERARLDSIYAEWEEAEQAHQAFEKEISARVVEVWNDNKRKNFQKKGFELEYSLLNSWSECIELLLKKENLWTERDAENMKNLKSV